MSRYTQLFNAIAELEANHKPPDMVDIQYEFPYKQCYPGQLEILSKVQDGSSFCMTSHTGFGKTACFLSLTRDAPSIVIEPRKFLQEQCSTNYYKDYVLYGRSGYSCNHAGTAAMAPCLLKVDCSDTRYHDTCQKANSTCLNRSCKIYPVDGTYNIYPCQDCEYIAAQKEAVQVLKRKGTVICNFGNFWTLLKHADTVVIDEADLFFREISAPMKIRYSKPKDYPSDSIKQLMDREVKGLQNAAKDSNAAFRYKMINILYNAQFLQTHHDLCFKYQRKDSFYIEIDPRNVNILSKKLFKDKRLIIVSATPGSFDLPSYSASIHQRCGIFFAPVGNLTSRSLAQNPYIMNQAAKAITEISNYFDMVYDNEHVIIHAGNLSTHATAIYKLLGEDNCTLHTSGKLAETISDYLLSGKRYLIIAAAEYGLDAKWSLLQFSLKHPFPNLDERMRTLQRTMGLEFNEYYANEARTRIIQLSGRNVRSFNDFGCTIFLDSKTYDDYQKNKGIYPEWFRERVDERCY